MSRLPNKTIPFHSRYFLNALAKFLSFSQPKFDWKNNNSYEEINKGMMLFVLASKA